MRTIRGVPAAFAALGLWSGSLGLAQEAAAPANAPANVIFDSDMDGDCDDVAALALLHALANRGEARILATLASGRNEWSPRCMAAINAWYGCPDVPLGAPREGVLRPSLYAQTVAQRCGPAPSPPVEEAVALYRRVLAAQPDASVTIVTVGFHTNLAALLRSPAAAGQPDGSELVRRKVRLWACMGGNFIGQPARDDLKLGNVNFQKDAPAAYAAIRNWPGRLVFLGREVASVPSGLAVGVQFRQLSAGHPVRVAYEAYFHGPAQNRHVADPATVLFAVRGAAAYWDLEERGYMDLREDMTFEWKYDRDGNRAYLRKRLVNGQPNDRLIEDAIAGLILAANPS